ncbi:MAG TPA: hypothetical protein VIL85_23830 [Thermomicrobiales bacterium]|jgi:hypothetical protein
MPIITACFCCGEDHRPAVFATLSGGHRIHLCERCLLAPTHVATFIGAFLAERRATAMAARLPQYPLRCACD